MKLIDHGGRDKMIEGRTTGLSFSICHLKDGDLHTVHPISACKDYLNDVIYTEATKKPYTAYGLTTKYTGCFEDGEAWLVGVVLGRHLGYPDAEMVKKLESNYPAIQDLLNQVEKLFKVDGRTEATKIGPNAIAFKIPLFWVKYTYLISIWSLFARTALKYKDGDVMGFLKNNPLTEDYYVMPVVLGKVDRMIKEGFPVQNLNVSFGVHNRGIYNFNF